jgi:hypothetical protein
MWTTLVLLMAAQVAPAQNPSLAIDGDRFTYGYHGPTRKDSAFLPGELVCLAFNIQNMTFNASGRASFSIAMEVLDGTGKSRFRQVPSNQQALNYLGGNTLQSVAELQLPVTAPPGDYTVKLTVTDRAAKTSTTLERKATVLPAGFGLIHVHTSADREGHVPTSPVGTLGEPLYINFAVVDFQRDGAMKQPNVEVALRVLDDKGAPATGRSQTGKADRDIPADLKIIPMQFGLTLNRLGRFTVELTATDKLSGKSSRVSFPVLVVALD